jgi:hypothetical protein
LNDSNLVALTLLLTLMFKVYKHISLFFISLFLSWLIRSY